MNPFLIVIIVFLAVLITVVAYNIYQENQYRRQIRRQFGHADHDALLGSNTQSVRDGQHFGGEILRRPLKGTAAAPVTEPAIEPESTEIELPLERDVEENAVVALSQADVEHEPRREIVVDTATIASTETSTSETSAPNNESSLHTADTPAESTSEAEHTQYRVPVYHTEHAPFSLIEETTPAPAVPQAQTELQFDTEVEEEPRHKRRLLVELNDLARQSLPWFDARFDYMAYVALYQPKELHSLPRLSSNHRFQVVGCTMDGRFQTAEPIPGVHYQAFVIGMQAISRQGLSSVDELKHFQQQVRHFADKIDGRAQFAPLETFLNQAVLLDELCARVDQTIAIHLVSRAGGISGIELRSEVEKLGLRLQEDGTFTMSNSNGNTEYLFTTLDGSPFTDALLSSQIYKGFSVLFDIPRVANGRDKFNQLMNILVSLSSKLRLDLVDEEIQPLSKEWLTEVREYIYARQEEMQHAHIQPGSNLAKRLFS